MYRYTNNIFSLVIAFGISFFVPPVFTANAQTVNDHKYNVLFLGNSYTYVNNLPLVTASAAASVGDSLVYDSNTMYFITKKKLYYWLLISAKND